MCNEELEQMEGIDSMVRWVSNVHLHGSHSIDLSGIVSDAPNTVEYSNVKYPFVRAALMKLSYERGMLELVGNE